MAARTPALVRNQLLAGLPSLERKRFLMRCEKVELVFGELLGEYGRPYRNLYFPLTGFISIMAAVADHPPLEIGLIGNEGMLGVTMVLGVDRIPMRAVVQGEGSAWRVGAVDLQDALQDSPALNRILHHYAYVVMAQLAQAVVCTRFHEVDARLARWLLMTHDRAHADHFHLTHQFLADMLGVQRGAVTIAAGLLRRRRLIGYSRGEISVLDRHGLEAVCCECYRAVNEDYRRLLA